MIDLLSSPAEDEEDLARQILNTIDDLRAQRTDYVLIQYDQSGMTVVFGPFDTKNSALKSIGHTVVGWHDSCRGAVLPLISTVEGVHVCSVDDDYGGLDLFSTT